MTRTRAISSPLPLAKALLTACAFAAAALIAMPAHAQDSVIAQARASGVVGEQADGYLGVVQGQSASADVRAHIDQVNIGRRAVYTQRAGARGVSVNEMAAAVACEIFGARIAVGERYRDENGAWRQRTASAPVALPSFCPH